MMTSVRKIWNELRHFLAEEIWILDLDELSRVKARFIKYVKIIIITIRTFSAQKIGFQAVALSFFGTMSVVPFLAFTFVVTGGLGLEDKLRSLMYENFSSYQDIINLVMASADNIINTAMSSGVGLVSSLLFLWVVLWMMISVERVFNNVWKVHKSRNIFKRISFYFLVLIIAPFVMMLFFSGSISYSNLFNNMDWGILKMEGVKSFVAWMLFYIVALLTFSAMYKFIPNAKVKYTHAFKAAVVSALAFTVLQYLYLETQLFVTRLNAVYGAMAAIPLFMFWLNFGWFIILFGAELSYAFQNVDNYNLDD
ncbi:MAG: YihY/virulence factor BrkB family protein [Bacteroidetes bacterium]|uniref:YihY/virulence factor BrkB family protein n=1 Tax=Candidatus Cryptobacteroides intestinigallinarum TaxID=2840767 RepID=A0A9D9HLC2_9BACT|nr:YihY/virulence factor BrkB family protein [Candidatus Cryptobacteroides intestinigallinarum]